VEYFDPVRGRSEMWTVASGAPVDHPFSRFTPGIKADKPRYDPGGWGAVLTSAGPAYIFYDPNRYDYMQYWFGGDALWHFTFEPLSTAVDLKPGDTVTTTFTLAYDSRDVPFNTGTVAFERPQMPEWAVPGENLVLKARATTAQAKDETVKVSFTVKDAAGKPLLDQVAAGTVKPFVFTELSAQAKLPADAALGVYAWEMLAADGKRLATGRFEVTTPDELAKRKMAKATADLKREIDKLERDVDNKRRELRCVNDLWRSGANLALSLSDPAAWPAAPPPGPLSVRRRDDAVPVLGLWKATELPPIQVLAAASERALPATAATMLAALGKDRKQVRSLAVPPDGRTLVVLVVDPAGRRTEIVRIGQAGVLSRFGRFSTSAVPDTVPTPAGRAGCATVRVTTAGS